MPSETTNNKIPDGFELYRALQGHTDVIHRLAWSPDGRMLASLSADTTIRIWDAETGNLCQMLEGHSGLIYDVTWSPAGQMLASTSLDQTTRLWNIKNGKVIQRLELFPF